MDRPKFNETLVFLALVSLGVAVRVWFQDIPNFAPVSALALFAGVFFRNRILALSTPLAVMAISDRLVDAGGYAWPLMLTVYGLLALPVVFGRLVGKRVPLEKHALAGTIGLVGSTLICSLIFFFGTNLMVWATSSWYEPTFAGLTQCLVSAVPFFRYTLAGDTVFGVLFFASYAIALALHRAANTDQDLVTA